MAAWGSWRSIPGAKTLSGPSAVGAVTVGIRSTDNTVYTNQFLSGTQWAGWKELSGMSTDTSPGLGNSVFVRRFDNKIFSTGFQGGNWTEVPGGGLTPSAPAVAGSLIVVRGTDNGIHYNAVTGSGWLGWRRVAGGGLTPSAPAVTHFGGGYLTVVRGTDDRIYYQTIGADFSTSGHWRPIPGHGKTFSAPAVVGSMVVVRGTDNKLHYNGFDGHNSWDGWREVAGGGQTVDSPALAHAPGFLTLVVRGMDDGVHYNFFS